MNGYALAGGMELALACDIRIASSNAKFGQSEVRVGSIPAAAGTQRLPRTVGLSDAMLMMLTGDPIDAAEALRIGLISRVVPQSELMDLAVSIARRIVDNAPLSVTSDAMCWCATAREMPLSVAIQSEQYVLGLIRDTRTTGSRVAKHFKKSESHSSTGLDPHQ